MNMEFYRKLPIPKDIKEQFPLSEAGAKALKCHKRKKGSEECYNPFDPFRPKWW